jgi:hypothetical protein
MMVEINSTIIFLSFLITLALIIITESALVVKEGITSTLSFENALAQQNSSNSAEYGDTGMTESDLGGKDIRTTASDLENDTDITKNNQTG